MQALLAATLIVLFGHGTAQACEAADWQAPARLAQTPLLVAQSNVSDPMLRTATDAPALVLGAVAEAPAMVRTAGRPDTGTRFAPRDERAAPAAAAAAADADEGAGGALLLVGLALMVGIALRRQGASLP